LTLEKSAGRRFRVARLLRQFYECRGAKLTRDRKSTLAANKNVLDIKDLGCAARKVKDRKAKEEHVSIRQQNFGWIHRYGGRDWLPVGRSACDRRGSRGCQSSDGNVQGPDQ
jgi:hypothetical protein